ncbi:MAG: TlpA disulfide reductase family protein [Flavobacteriales bacterium]
MLRTLLALACSAGCFFSSYAQKPGSDQRRLEIVVKGVSNDTVFLANYYGNKLYYTDTTMADAKGRIVFQSKAGYKSGVYAVVVPGPKYFEILLDEPEVILETDTADLLGHLVVKKSVQNQLFVDYIKHLNTERKAADALKLKIEAAHSPKEKEELKLQQKAIDPGIRAYQENVAAQVPGSLLALILNMSMVKEPIRITLPDGTLDTAATYFANRAAYWSGTNLTDERILRTPVFHNKLNEYLGKNNVAQIPDTINKLADDLIARLGPSDELFKFVVHNITLTAENSDIMGMDAVFVHMALTYYCPKKDGKSRAFWMPEEQLDKLCKRATKEAPLIIGAKTRNLILPDTTEQKWSALHQMPEEYVVLVFWESTCGHCKKEIPELHKVWKERMQAMDVGVYAVCKATDSTMMVHWKDFIVEHDLDWVNVGLTWNVYREAKAEPYKYIPQFTTLESLNYADTYDVYSTPKIFVLDRERKIIAKSLSPEQIADLVQRLQETKRRKELKP